MAPRARRVGDRAGEQGMPAPEHDGRVNSDGADGEREHVLAVRRTPLTTASAVPDPRPMPTDFSISLQALGAADRLIVEPGGRPRRQPMRGFEDTFSDIVDFILRVTHQIWEEKAIGYLYEHYRHNTTVVDDSGLTYGRDRVIEGTAQFMSAFPDARLFGDEVIWCGDEDLGFSCSHRVLIVGHNTGYSQFGPPTGRRIAVWCMANTRSYENQIVEEHVIYNTSSLLRQLGHDLPTTARELGNREFLDTPGQLSTGEVERLLGQGHPQRPPAPVDGEDVGTMLRRAQQEIWNWRLVNKVDDYYAESFRFHGPTDRELVGVGCYKAYVLELVSMFPDLAYRVDDLYWMGNDAEGYLVATRWSITGTHRGFGYYGSPTGRRILMWGLTHQRVLDRRVVEEWTVSNEFDVMMQLYRDAVGHRA